MNGMTAEKVASSWIEALGGVSMCWIFSTPPDFWASPGHADANASAAMMTGDRVGFSLVSSVIWEGA